MEGITGIPMFSEEGLYTEKKPDSIGRDEFLKLFLAQLNHQDPLNPMDSQEFTSQLAQFSSVEQLFNVNENLESIKSTEDEGARFQVLNFIGKEVIAEGDRLTLDEGLSSRGGFTLDDSAYCMATVLDSRGYPIRTLSLGELESGEHTFTWDGRDEAGILQDPGVYNFEVTAMAPDGQLRSVETRIQGLVSRVNLEGTSPLLYVGDIPLSLSQVMEIKTSTQAEGSQTADE
jgi:flagellar basal-body rod modification protein FlgD